MEPATGTLVVYSPGYEDRPAWMSGAKSVAGIPFAQPVLSLKAIGGPFDFNIEIMPIDDARRPSGTAAALLRLGVLPISSNRSWRDQGAPGTEAQSPGLGR